MEYFDQLETRAPADRERDLFAKLPGQIENAQKNAPYLDRKSTRLNSSHIQKSRMPSSA